MRKLGPALAFLAVIAGTAAAAPQLSDIQIRTALTAISRAGEDGLDPAAYPVAALPDPPTRDAAISAALITYMRDIRAGRPQLRASDADVLLPPVDFDASAALQQAVSEGKLDALLAGLAPPAPDYARLKNALAHYRRIADAGGWPLVSPDSEFGLLRVRLAFEDNITGLSDADALRRFQARQGLIRTGRWYRRRWRH